MRKKQIATAVAEAKKFMALANAVLAGMAQSDKENACKQDEGCWYGNPVLTGALRRSSLDLTRALAAMRKP